MAKLEKILKCISVILLICCVMQLSCKKDTSLDLSGTYTIKLNETQRIPANENGATIKVADIKDSRCPINANCASAGSATVTIVIEDAKQLQVVTLCIGDCASASKQGTKVLTLNNEEYTVSIDNVTPFPGEPNTTKMATIRIIKGIIYI